MARLLAEPEDPTRRNLEEYVGQRVERLERVANSLEGTEGPERMAILQEVLSEAYGAADGLQVFDQKLHDYVVGIANKASGRFRNVGYETQIRLVADVIEAVRDAPILYHR